MPAWLKRCLTGGTTIVVLHLACGPVRAESLQADTVWSGEVRITDKVVVEKDVTLLVMPGTRLLFEPIPQDRDQGGGRLVVFGTLIAQGSSDRPIEFTVMPGHDDTRLWEGVRFEQADEQPSRLACCRIEKARTAISGRASQLQVEHCTFRHNRIGIVAHAGFSGSLFDCLLTENDVGMHFEGNERLRVGHSRFLNNRNNGIHCSNSAPTIHDCTFRDNGEQGIACRRGSSPLIENCGIHSHPLGIEADMHSSPVVLNNNLTDNDVAISLQRRSFAVIDGNRIEANRVGIICNLGAYPRIKQNNLAGNGQWAIGVGANQSAAVARMAPFEHRREQHLPLPTDVSETGAPTIPADGLIDARNNWWGKAVEPDETGNSRVIDDGYDQPLVNFQDTTYPRDKVAITPAATRAFPSAGRQEIGYSRLAGKVLAGRQPVAGVRVVVYADADALDKVPSTWLTYSRPTDAEGGFALTLSPGRYQLEVVRGIPPLRDTATEHLASLHAVEIRQGETTKIVLDDSRP